MNDHSNRFLMRAAWDVVRLAETISHAYESTRFYRKYWDAHGVRPDAFKARASLELFPTVVKADIVADPAAFISATDPPDIVRDTSGTTGVRLAVYMNSAEDEALAQLRSGRAKGHPIPRVVLRILPPPRRLEPISGRDVAPTTTGLVQHILPSYDPAIWYDSIDQLLGVLVESYYVRDGRASVEVIHTTPPPLFGFISQQLVSRGIDPQRLGIYDILLTGGPLFSWLRQNLARTWKAAISTTFSCTEVRGEAMECPLDPGVYHASPSIVAEVLDLRTLEPVADGEVGEIALTGLFPFQRCMPMVRYRPGDLARLSAGPCRCGSAMDGIKVLGRTRHAIDLSEIAGRRCILGTFGCFEAIHDTPQVPQFPYPRATAICTRQDGAPALFELKIEATNPRAFDAATAEREILQRLRTTQPELAELEDAGDLTLRVTLTEKNALADFYRLYPGR